jgi:hypothetical protein
VLASPVAALVGVYDGHGMPYPSQFLRSSLFPHAQLTSITPLFSINYFLPNFSTCSC